MEEEQSRKELCLKIKKLALAFQTGWEYRPESGEPGSVLMDAFCDMLLQNSRRFDRIWEKHTAGFLSVMPEEKAAEEKRILETGIYAGGECDGRLLPAGTKVFLYPEQGEPFRFVTAESLRLTAAELLYVLYQDGMYVWQIYEKGRREQKKRKLAEPVFCWQYENLCNGRAEVRFLSDAPAVSGEWSISDGENSYPLKSEKTAAGLLLTGKTPGFWENVTDCIYELQLRFPSEEAPSGALLCRLSRPLVLKEEGRSRMVQLCLTEEGAAGGERVLPFGSAPEPPACCYFACDEILAVKGRRITLEFTESFLEEQKLPPPAPEEYRRLYRKYPWLKEQAAVSEWRTEETVWEYFDGNLWRPLPGSAAWRTGCAGQSAEDMPKEGKKRSLQWLPPETMRPCVVEGQEHYYIRLRLEKTVNEYAQYYRKQIPVLENIRVSAAPGETGSVGQRFPEISEAGKKRLYFGFDREITGENRWYTPRGSLSFRQEALDGWGSRYGREAFWAEADEAETEGAADLFPNYVRAVQTAGETGFASLKAEKGRLLSVETDGAGVLDARLLREVSFADTREMAAPQAVSDFYPASFGRLVTPGDIAGWIRRRYPELRMASCVFQKERKTLLVVLDRPQGMPEEEMREILSEPERRLEQGLAAEGSLWLAGCHVSCVFEQAGEERESGEKAWRTE